MEKGEIMYDHYKETCEICRNNEKDRNRLFSIVCFLLTLLFLLVIGEKNVMGMLHAWFKGKYEYDLTLSVDTIQSLVWMLLLYFTVRYYQQCIGIERLYQYIHEMEERLVDEFSFAITREGKGYLKGFPCALNFIWIIYALLFPVLYLILVVIKIGTELCGTAWNGNLFLHVVLAGCNIVLTVLYLLFLHRMK